MNLYIRADADPQIGTGHIMRCIALAQAWQDHGGIVTFISHCESEALRQRIIGEGFDFISVENPHPDPSDLKQTLEKLSALSPQLSANCWLVLDGYHFTPDYQKAIRDTGIRLLVIDDMNHLPYYHADILLNQNIHAQDLKYNCDEDTTLLLGTRYVLLRREFLEYRNFNRNIPEHARNILVTLGGGDPDNVTLKVIQTLNLIGDPNIEVKVVVGPANPNIENLQKELTLSPFTFHLSPNVSNMSELMAWADVAVTAAGSTCWELSFMGVPSITVVTFGNQIDVAKGLERAKICKTVGWCKATNNDVLVAELSALMEDKKLREEKSRLGRQLIDGNGAKNIVYTLSEQCGLKH